MKKTRITRFFERIFYRRYKAEADSADSFFQNEEYERCVMCGQLTSVRVSMPIESRENYEIGLGQVCVSCKEKLREKEKQTLL